MGVSNVIRGEDHITSTPRQILLIQALGGKVPNYAHLPLIVGADKKKLSKRHGAVSYQKFADAGYMPEAIINYLALLGWSAGDDREFYTLDELIEAFTLEGVSKSPAMFSYEKLNSINRHYLVQMSKDAFELEIMKHLTPTVINFLLSNTDIVKDVIIHTIIKERIDKWSDVQNICESEFSWLQGIDSETFDIEKVVWKKSNKEDTKKHLNLVVEVLSKVSDEDWAKSTDTKSNEKNKNNAIKMAIWDYASSVGRGDVLWPMRYALTSKDRSPDPFTVAFVLGKNKTLVRLKNIIDAL